MKKYNVYCVKNNKNGKMYFGISDDTENIIDKLKGGNKTLISQAISDHGKDNFSSHLLDEQLDENDAIIRVNSYISKFDSISTNGYNTTYHKQNTKPSYVIFKNNGGCIFPLVVFLVGWYNMTLFINSYTYSDKLHAKRTKSYSLLFIILLIILVKRHYDNYKENK